MALSFVYLAIMVMATVASVIAGEPLPAVLLAMISAGCALAFRAEWKAWNHGVNRSSGRAWKSFDTDSSGAVGYKDGDGHTFWLSYFNGDKHRNHQEDDDAIRRGTDRSV